jgi:hypothetical protein
MHIYGLIVLDWAYIMKIDSKMNVKGVKPKWRGYKKPWISLTILMWIHICQTMWIKLKLDWSQRLYQEDIQARIIILKKWFSWMLNVDSRYDVPWGWLNRMKIARKELWGTKRRWRVSDSLKTEVPWLR